MSLVRVVALAAVLLALPARAGVVIEGKEGEQAQRIVMEGQKLRMEGRDAEGKSVMIFDGGARRSVQLHPDKKSYVEFTNDDLKAMAAMAKQAQARHGAPAPAKKKDPSTRYQKTGRTESALGKRCDVYAVKDGDAAEEEMCIVPFGTFGVQKEDFTALRSFGEFTADMAGGDLDRGWADLPGVPLLAWKLEDGDRKETFRATKIEKARVPASEFAVPAGWKKEPGFTEQMRQMKEQMGGAKQE